MRLDKYLSEKTNYSRNQLSNLIKNGGVKVNNKIITKPSFKVSEIDKIEYEKAQKIFTYSVQQHFFNKSFFSFDFFKICSLLYFLIHKELLRHQRH